MSSDRILTLGSYKVVTWVPDPPMTRHKGWTASWHTEGLRVLWKQGRGKKEGKERPSQQPAASTGSSVARDPSQSQAGSARGRPSGGSSQRAASGPKWLAIENVLGQEWGFHHVTVMWHPLISWSTVLWPAVPWKLAGRGSTRQALALRGKLSPARRSESADKSWLAGGLFTSPASLRTDEG